MRRFCLAAAIMALAACTPHNPDAEIQAVACFDEEMSPEDQIDACSAFLTAEGMPAIRRARTLAQRSAAYEGLDDFEHARADMLAAIALAPNDQPLRQQSAYFHMREGDNPAAIADLNVAIARGSNDYLYFVRSQALDDAHDYEGAVADMNAALRLAPGNASYLNQRCWIRAKAARDLDMAIADCNRGIAIQSSAAILDSRGVVRLQLQQFEQALADFEAALAIEPEEYHSLYGRGIAASHLGRAEDAARDIAAALAGYPEVAERYASYGITPFTPPATP
ncbi:MAG: tetratricopeptide repeat protein [Terricaulis sp.]